ncbi:MAG: type II secretion system F family protein [Bacteriovoracaceae bacterium]|nr:type II secretion system F family protein [Bacteriovoracaceae bacterium]
MNDVSLVSELLGHGGVVGVIGVTIFTVCFRYSNKIFEWIEQQTFGTRNHILEEFNRLFIDVKPEHITYVLLFLSFGLGFATVILFGVFSLWGVGLSLGAVISFVGWKIPRPFVQYLVKKRIKAYQDQLIDSLTLLANGIRAGLSVPQSLGMVVDEMPVPISQEFNVILQQNRVGVPLEECFENLSKRIPIEDNDMFVSSINILRETGGNLAETFDTIVIVIRERIRLQQKIDTYVAQGMIQAYTIGAMPFVIGALFVTSNPEAGAKMVSNPIGLIMVVGAIALDAIGMMIIMKIIKIEV